MCAARAKIRQAGANERRLLDALRDLFVGVKVDGQSGYINLMRIKARYFQHAVEPALMADIAAALAPFPAFREELFDNLHAFFSRYFSRSGSICFACTPQRMSVYEKVCTDEQDVVLFWKTHMLYYVKTDRLFRDLRVEIDGQTFFFDCTNLEHKKANEKRELVFSLDRVDTDGVIRLGVTYSERGRKTKPEDLLIALNKAERSVKEATLDKAMKVFARQSEVDYFINQDAKGFLREQLDLWMYQYLFKDQTHWSETRVRQLQVIGAIALKLIDFISQFEDELVRIWNKPKFVRGSHYVVTLDRLAARPGGLGMIADLMQHAGMAAQVAEWRELGMAGDDFEPTAILVSRGRERMLTDAWKFLPIDTKYFASLECALLGLFDDLDEELDGRVIRSDNYQALNTLREKFKNRVRCCYIDPPYNSGGAGTPYLNEYRSSSWLSLMDNRVMFVHDLLKDKNSGMIVAIDDFEAPHLIRLLRERFPDFDINPLVVNHHPQGSPKANISRTHEYAILVTPRNSDFVRVPRPADRPSERRLMRSGTGRNNFRKWRPNSFYAILVDESTAEIKGVEEPPAGEDYPRGRTKEGWLRIYPINSRGEERIWRKYYDTGRRNIRTGEIFARQGRDGIVLFEKVATERVKPTSNWTDSRYNAGPHGTDLLAKMFGTSGAFAYPKSLHAVSDLIDSFVFEDADALVLDFFAGSATTGHAILNQNRHGCRRKYVLIETAEYCDTVVLPRLKKAAFADTWDNGKPLTSNGVSHFLKYFHLEQYEDVLTEAVYVPEGDDLFANTRTDSDAQYVLFRDPRTVRALERDYANNDVHVRLDRFYPDIDVAETLSCVTGKWIKRITADAVEFADGSKQSLTRPDWRLLKPLIFWGAVV